VKTAGKAGQLAAMFFLLAVLSVGCVPRDALEKMQDQLNYLESAQRRNQREMARIDSLLAANTNANRELRADVVTSLDEIRREMTVISQNMVDLGEKINRRGTEHPVVIYPDQPGGDSATGIAPGTAAGADQQLLTVDCGRIYDQGFNDLRNGNYELAIEGFEEFLGRCASSPDVPRALYWLGECHYSNDDFAAGIEVFDKLVAEHPNSDYVPGALFKLGRCYEKSDQPRHAVEYYERLVADYPNAPYVPPAQQRLDNLKAGGD
jgi:tol-pal system protein YbgF